MCAGFSHVHVLCFPVLFHIAIYTYSALQGFPLSCSCSAGHNRWTCVTDWCLYFSGVAKKIGIVCSDGSTVCICVGVYNGVIPKIRQLVYRILGIPLCIISARPTPSLPTRAAQRDYVEVCPEKKKKGLSWWQEKRLILLSLWTLTTLLLSIGIHVLVKVLHVTLL